MTLPKNTSLFRELAPRYMARLMADFPWTDEDAAAAMGSAGVESLGFTLMQEVAPRGGRGGLGPFQWTGPRRIAFEKWLDRKKAKPTDFEACYAFLFRELKGDERATIDAVRKAKAYSEKLANGRLVNRSSLYAKTKAFERAFERAGVPAWDKRLEWAQLALDTYRAAQPRPAVIPASVPSQPQEKTMNTISPISIAGGINPASIIGGVLSEVIGRAVGRASQAPTVPIEPGEQARVVANAVANEALSDPRLKDLVSDPAPKPFWQSTTFWGVVISIVFKLLAVLLPGKVDPSWEGVVTGWLPTMISFLGDGLAFFGRFRATAPLTLSSGKPDAIAELKAQIANLQAQIGAQSASAAK